MAVRRREIRTPAGESSQQIRAFVSRGEMARSVHNPRPKELERVPEDPGNAGLTGSGSDRRSAVEIVKRVCGTQWRALSTAAAFGTAPPGHLGMPEFPWTSSLILTVFTRSIPGRQAAGYFFAHNPNSEPICGRRRPPLSFLNRGRCGASSQLPPPGYGTLVTVVRKRSRTKGAVFLRAVRPAHSPR